MGNEQSSPTSPTRRRPSELSSSQRQGAQYHAQAHRTSVSASPAAARTGSTTMSPNPLGAPRRVSPGSRRTLQPSPAVSRTPSRTSPLPSPAPPLPAPREARRSPAQQPNDSLSLPAVRPISTVSIGSGIAPPPYSPVDERFTQGFEALRLPGSGNDSSGEEYFQTPEVTPLELPTPTPPPVQAASPAPTTTSAHAQPHRQSQRRHHSGGSSSSSHRRTQSSSSGHGHAHAHANANVLRELPPTPDDDDERDRLPPTTRPLAGHTRPDTPPLGSAGSRYTSFRVAATVQAPAQESVRAPDLSRQTSHGSTRTHGRRGSSGVGEDPLVLLRKYDTIILVDDSVSMIDLWGEAKTALAEIATMAAHYDVDGVDIHFVSNQTEGIGLKSADDVIALFDSVQPAGADSEIGGRLEEFLLPYLSRAERYHTAVELGTAGHVQKVRPINFIILTDGVPSDDPESVIVSAARRLDAHNFPLSQVGMQFVQLGDDPEATEVLQHLDDGLSKAYGIRDIVDWTYLPNGKLEAGMLTKILLGGINRRIDGKAGH